MTLEILLYIFMQSDLELAPIVQKYFAASVIIGLSAAVIFLAKAYIKLTEKALTVLGETREVIRQNTDVMSKVKDKL